MRPIPVAARSKACLRQLASWNCVFESNRGNGLCPESVVFLQVDVSESGLLLIQRSNADCNMSVCDRESSIMSKPWPTGSVEPWRQKLLFELYPFWTRGNKRKLSRCLQTIGLFHLEQQCLVLCTRVSKISARACTHTHTQIGGVA